MKRVRIHKSGGYDRLRVEDFELEPLKENEVRVETQAIGVNYADCIIRWGLYESAKQYVGWPITPGFEFAGKVVGVGKNVARFDVGDPVFGVKRFGSYASHVNVPEHQVFSLPDGQTVRSMAGFPTVFITAYHALFQHFILRSGMKVLVHSAAGGVGSALVQLATLAGCEVTAIVGREHKSEVPLRYGAKHVLVREKENWWERARDLSKEGFDVVLDANGGSSTKESYALVRPTGKLVVYGAHTFFPQEGGKIQWVRLLTGFLKTLRLNPLNMTQDNKSVVGFNLSFLFERKDLLNEAMNQLNAWLKEEKITPLPFTAFPMDQVAEAHRALESGQTTGKLILIP